MAFIAQNDLESALIAAATDAGARPLFHDLFLGAEIYAIIAGPPPATNEDGETVGDETLRFATVEHEGLPYVCVFTSVARIQEAVDRETPYLSMNGRRLLEGTSGANLIVNPSSEYGKFLPAQEIRAMLNGEGGQRLGERHVEAGTAVSFMSPECPLPDGVISGIVDFLGGEPHVRQARLLQAQFEGDSEPGHLLVLLLDDIDHALGIMQRFSPRLDALLPDGVFLDTWPVAALPDGVEDAGCQIYPRGRSPWWRLRRA